jgi:hypothetical protein
MLVVPLNWTGIYLYSCRKTEYQPFSLFYFVCYANQGSKDFFHWHEILNLYDCHETTETLVFTICNAVTPFGGLGEKREGIYPGTTGYYKFITKMFNSSMLTTASPSKNHTASKLLITTLVKWTAQPQEDINDWNRTQPRQRIFRILESKESLSGSSILRTLVWWLYMLVILWLVHLLFSDMSTSLETFNFSMLTMPVICKSLLARLLMTKF